jgi:2-keto-4-pentenoate hydratase/2-oxohepta-3-ene-1,7-dioic acid hydratase in catechol pathway
MKLLRFGKSGEELPAILDGNGQARSLVGIVPDISPAVLATQLAELRQVDVLSLPIVPSGSRIGPPVSFVGKFICIGLNYRDHAAEANMPIPEEPIIFMKATSAIIGPHDDVVLPLGAAKGDWEVELGIIIGRECRYVLQADALMYVAGLCVVNDVSERAFQFERGGQWDKGKSCDTFGPIGPYLVTLDEIDDVNQLDLWLNVNGDRMQTGNTCDMIFDVAYLVHYVSQFMSLQPGDVIATGTPAGVGLARSPQRWLRRGDAIHLGITGLGEQRQAVR